jgi:hypothetical protein
MPASSGAVRELPGIMIAGRRSGTRCSVCTGATTRDQSAHHLCGGSLPADPREYLTAAVHHIETRVLRRPQTLDGIAHRLRPELAGYLDEAMSYLVDAGAVTFDGGKFTRVASRHRRRPQPEQLDLFELT